MKLILRKDYDAMSTFAANLICNRIKNYEKNRKESGKNFFVLGLPTGSTPLGTYKRLIEMHKKGDLSFKHVITFNMDEYVGIPRDDAQSYHTFMFNNFFQHIDIEPHNVHILDGNAPDLRAECAFYELKILEVGGIDLFLGGIGANGHVAFNEPGSSLRSRTRLQALTRETIAANSRFFDGETIKVPTHALTVGIATIMDANEVIILANGEHKARAIRDAIEGGISHMCTASAFQNHTNTMFIVDEPAARKLRVETLRIFADAARFDNEDNSGTEFNMNSSESRLATQLSTHVIDN